MLNKNAVNFLGCDAEYADAKIVLFGAPFDGTASFRPGARFAPAAIRNKSYALETYSPYQDRDLADIAVFDSGDLELSLGDSEKVLAAIEERAGAILADRKIPFLIGGEHLVTLAALRAVFRKYPNLRLVSFDAHADLRDDYLGVKLSHACVIRRCHDILGDGRIFQFGIRSGDQSEYAWNQAQHTSLHPYDFTGLEDCLDCLKNEPLYLTIDLDVLDPAVLPGTGTPEPGGVNFDTLRRAITVLCQNCRIAACDVTELSPSCDPSGSSTLVAIKIIREMLLAIGSR